MGASDLLLELALQSRHDRLKYRHNKLEALKSSKSNRRAPLLYSSDPSSSAASNPAPESSDQQANHGENYMPVLLYRAAAEGDADNFIKVVENIMSSVQGLDFSQIIELVTPSGNTLLHIAASHGHQELAELLFVQAPSLVMKQNSVGDTSLHLVIRAGHQQLIRDLLHGFLEDNNFSDYRRKNDSNIKTYRVSQRKRQTELLRVSNREGNTALHEFVMSQHYSGCSSRACSTLKFMIEDPTVRYLFNNEGKSPLYLAAEAGKESFVKEMLVIGQIQICIAFFQVKSPLLPPIRTGNKALIDTILQIEPAFINLLDEDGKTPLHHAASVGCIEVIKCLIEKDVQCTLKKDTNGFFPIHIAAAHGHIHAVMELLEHCPEPEEMLTSSGQNILHVAAASGKHDLVIFLLETYSCLINERDDTGNTPLHIATINWHPKVVSKMTWDKRVDLRVVNHEGLTALDVAEYNMGESHSYEKRLTWIALEAAGAPRSSKKDTPNLISRDDTSERQPPNIDRYRDRVNTLLVVATLVATVTFAAGFTMPGGNNEESSANQGMAIMLQKKAFHVFIICDTIAMLCSILVVISLIWAQLGDLKLVLMALRLAIPLLGVGLIMMSLAFIAGAYLVVTQLNWLAYTVLIMGFIFLVAIFVLLLPLCLPLYSQNSIFRRITYYPFYLFILITVKS